MVIRSDGGKDENGNDNQNNVHRNTHATDKGNSKLKKLPILKYLFEDELSRDRRYETIFNRLDINKDGKITQLGLNEAFVKNDMPLKNNNEALVNLFHAMDANDDKIIDLEDFKIYAKTAEKQIRSGFEKIDTDGDGLVKPEEISNYLIRLSKDAHQDPIKLDNGNNNSHNSKSMHSEDKVSRKHPSQSLLNPNLEQFISWAFHMKGKPDIILTKSAEHMHKSDPKGSISSNGIDQNTDQEFITYDQWRDFLLMMPKSKGSRLQTAYFYLFKEDVDLSSEGDMTLINDFLKGFGFFIAGGISGVISRTCTAPFDRLKVFLIARTDLTSTLLHSKKSIAAQKPNIKIDKIRSPIIKAITTLYNQGGLRAFYVGNGLNVMKVFPESSIKFGSFEMTKSLMASIEGIDNKNELSKVSTYIAGGLAGVVAQFSIYPIDTLKFRVQCASLGGNALKGNRLLFETAKQLYREGGIKLFYRGILVGLMGVFPYAALDLGTFSALKKWYINKQSIKLGIPKDDVELSNLVVLPMGALSGTVGASIVYPINLLRTRLQAQGTYAHPYRYTGIKDVFIQTVKRESYSGLYKGLLPTLAKVCPAVSISYLCYENLKKVMKLENH
ncbi:hypothetical protein TPHA_0F01510 [Tetrapisispora phaffii CBS 4417]|uniref:EF-hand domain-containing protein n=1 Tax=Tetrapisispora phaffii (strain ATCC 24235 / CBS 4417 / NBRC 1672 / NRRL Y-8282 / UCD 70-5) TaxID=1071381 RepID=G8BV53_TETPH|nr:hypothetical protein TPHA_0F01510 [Tetrapisispora phaffii CBS 4417]CCE63635.1 hypothetical protein TPHA_0F01510 [Tetrapisispora phaffii CBS 4417]